MSVSLPSQDHAAGDAGDVLLGMESPLGPDIVLGGRRYLYFGGTGYHALQGHPAVIEAAAAALRQYGMGTATGGTHPVGPSPVQQRLEATAARFFGTEDAVCFASGYMANAVGLAGLAEAFDRVYIDATAHWSLRDAAALSGKPVVAFAHRDPADLAQKLRSELAPGEIPLVASDGVFPTLGECAPVRAYLDVLAPHRGLLWLDDAHAVGVLGPEGRGTLDACGIASSAAFFGGSLAKAFGGHGGVIPGSAAFCRRLRQASGFLRGATGISVPAAAAATAGMEILMQNPHLRSRLAAAAARCKAGLRELGITLPDTPHPVAAFSLGCAARHLDVHRALMRRGMVVPYSRYVGAGEAGVLRIAVFSCHTDAQIDRLLAALRELVPDSRQGERNA